MQRLVVKEFGPLKDIDLEIKDFMVFIGPNASGKSTLVNLIYFFQSLPARLVEVLIDSFGDKNLTPEMIPYNITYVYHNQYFPEKTHKTSLKFYFSEDFTLKLDFSKTSGQITPLPFLAIFNDNFKKLVADLFDLKIFFENKLDEEGNQEGFKSYKFLNTKNSFQKEIERIIDAKFSNLVNSSKVFIPENRNSNEGNWGEQIKSSSFYLQNFLNGERSFPQSVIEILKGVPFEYNRNEFGIKSENGDIFKFNTLSSGQKNAFWLVLVLFQKSMSNFENEYNNIIIEEPENHLFPNEQKSIIELTADLFNKNQTKIYLTTHSHYIIGAINILINAFRIGQLHADKVEKVIPKNLWLNKDNIFMGYLRDGKLENIYSESAEMFDHDVLTKTSAELNSNFDKLMEIEFEDA
jgi:predicted ATPase